jgi:hypothetical protein
MISSWNHDIARQRQQELLAAAERSGRARIARDHNAHARSRYGKTAYAALLATRSELAAVVERGSGANGGP